MRDERRSGDDMPSTRYRGPPMTLANMRHNGVRSFVVVYAVCHHEAVLNVDTYAVPSFGAHGLQLLRHHRAPTCGPNGASDHKTRA